jgi:large subunit ribosomal protein L30
MEHAKKKIRIEWVRSGIGFHRRQEVVVRSLGLRRLHDVVERPDTPQLRGAIAKVAHLVRVVEAAPAVDSEEMVEYSIGAPLAS